MKAGKSKNKKLLKLAEKFQPWDYSYLISIEKQALKQMLEYHRKADIIEEHSRIANKIELAIKLLDIADETTMAYKSSGNVFGEGFKDWVNVYINARNWRRFIYSPQWSMFDWTKPCLLHYLRVQKAWHLYNLLRSNYMQDWWA